MSAIDTYMRERAESRDYRDKRSQGLARGITTAVTGIGNAYAEHQAREKLKQWGQQRYGLDPNDPAWENPESTKAMFIDADRKERANKALKAIGMDTGAAMPAAAFEPNAIPSYMASAAGGAAAAGAAMPGPAAGALAGAASALPPPPAPRPQPTVGGMDRMGLLRRGLGEGMDPRDAMLLTGVLPKGAEPMTDLDTANAEEARARAEQLKADAARPHEWVPTTKDERFELEGAQHPPTQHQPRRTVTAEDVQAFGWPPNWVGRDSADAIDEAQRRGLNAPAKAPSGEDQPIPDNILAVIEKALGVAPGTLKGATPRTAGTIPTRQGESPEATEIRRLRLQALQADAASLKATLRRRTNDPEAQKDLANLIGLEKSSGSGQMGADNARTQLMEQIPALMTKYGLTSAAQPAAGAGAAGAGSLPPPPPLADTTGVDSALKAEFDAFPAARQQELLNKMSAEEKKAVGR